MQRATTLRQLIEVMLEKEKLKDLEWPIVSAR